ncbi:MAG: (d)CMP kinase [Chloroflexi bacterium]|nr:(d)CMP kinase [Chloroflexota bacterium]
MRNDSLQIAIDGPVGAGKTSVGRLLARRLGARFLDTGLTYRAVTLVAIDRGISPDDAEAIGRLAAEVRLEVASQPDGESRVLADGKDVTDRLRTPEVDRFVSAVSAMPAVRSRMVDVQRAIASTASIVMVGRDIGTVVLPGARLKVYLTASDETRARRRYEELRAQGTQVDYESVLKALRRRDRIDSGREASPLRPARDARIVNTDRLGLEEVVSTIERMAAGA